MKVTSINNYIKRHPNSHSMFRGEGEDREQLSKTILPNSNQEGYVSAIKLQNKTVNKTINKTAVNSGGFFNAKNTPSFGSAASVTQKETGKFVNWLAESKMNQGFLRLAAKNPAVFEALAALVVAGAVRPATIMSLPASKADKEKNKKAAAHSISSGVIGFVSTFVLFKPIIDAMDKLKTNPQKYGLDAKDKMFERLNFNLKGKKCDPTRIKIYNDFMKYSPKILFAPLTAFATIALIPVIDKNVISKVFKNPAVQKAELTPMDVYRSTSFKSTDKGHKAFRTFIGGQS